MVNPLVAIGIHLFYNSVADELRHTEILLRFRAPQIIFIGTFDQAKVDAAQIWCQDVVHEITVLLFLKVFNSHLMRFVFGLELEFFAYLVEEATQVDGGVFSYITIVVHCNIIRRHVILDQFIQ
jgi:hypothetical protein